MLWQMRLDIISEEKAIANKIYLLTLFLKTGHSPLHTAWYINDKGDKIWLKFDASIPCTMFPTQESR